MHPSAPKVPGDTSSETYHVDPFPPKASTAIPVLSRDPIEETALGLAALGTRARAHPGLQVSADTGNAVASEGAV